MAEMSDEGLAILNSEFTVDPEGYGYDGDAAHCHVLFLQDRSFDPVQYNDPDVSVRDLAALLVVRGSWADLVDVIGSNNNARLFHEAAHLDLTVTWVQASTIVTNLIPSVLAAEDGTALQAAFRTERKFTRESALLFNGVTIEDCRRALEYTP